MVKWKREEVPDHKFDYVDVHEFERADCLYRVKYSWVFLIVLKSVLVYIADLWTASALLLTDKWAGAINPKIPFEYSKWIFVGSIVASFILLTLEIKKANSIISSRDISVALTNMVAYRYYTLMSYGHWCFFLAIRDRQKRTDKIAFFVYFGFKGWKRLLFCDGPRQVINFITLFSLFQDTKFSHNPSAYGTVYRKAAMGVMGFTVAIFISSVLLLLLAFVLYLPLLCKIRGNLKEYCCHMIDKRISELLNNQRARRIKQTTKEHKITIQPTLPELDDVPQNVSPIIQSYPTTPGYNQQDGFNQRTNNSQPIFPQSKSAPIILNNSYAPDSNNSGRQYPAPSGRQQTQYTPQNKYDNLYSAKGSVSIPIPAVTTYKTSSYEAENMSPTRPTNPYRMDVSATSLQQQQQQNTSYYTSSRSNTMPSLHESIPYSPSQYNYSPDHQNSTSISPMATPQGASYPMPGHKDPYVTRTNVQQNPQASSTTVVSSSFSINSKSSDGVSVRTNSPPVGRYGQDRVNRRRHDNYILQGGRKN